MAEVFGANVAVYDLVGRQLAGYGDAMPPLDEVPNAPSARRRGRTHLLVVPLAGGQAYLVGSYVWDWGSPAVWLLIPFVVLLVLAVVSVPMARTIARPIERITTAARALGEGDLSARTGVDNERGDELGVLARTFDEMASRLERMVNNEKELLANASHELRTPLARIRIALELAEDAHDLSEYRRQLEGISGDLEELEQLVEQVLLTTRLDLAAAPDGTLPLERTPTAINPLIDGVEQRFVRRHGLDRLEVTVEEGLPEIDADPKLLRRVLDNLLDNAAKYMNADDGIVELRATLAVDEDAVVVSVSDRGIGVADEDLAMIFEPFFRTKRSREGGISGVGMGLALCRRIINAHRGQIEATSRQGGGLEVRFSIPIPGLHHPVELGRR